LSVGEEVNQPARPIGRPRGEEVAMRFIGIVILALLGICSLNNPLQAQSAIKCADCREHLRVCKSNYSENTCRTEYEICMKACQQK
jgi:hypothetical protein